jgi:predicted nucleotidyltransferase
MEALGIGSALFSKVQQRVLALIFGQPERSFFTSEIVRSIASGTGAVTRELSRLRRSGLVEVERIGNQTHYRANPRSPIFGELRSLIAKTVDLAAPLRKSLEPHAGAIQAAFIYGSVAKGSDTAHSDIDLMVVGDALTYADLYAALADAEDVLGRKISPIFLTVRDWRRKLADRQSLVGRIWAQPKIFVLGAEADLRL